MTCLTKALALYSCMLSAKAALSFWYLALEHANDTFIHVCRVSCQLPISPVQRLTELSPKTMGIMPFGCAVVLCVDPKDDSVFGVRNSLGKDPNNYLRSDGRFLDDHLPWEDGYTIPAKARPTHNIPSRCSSCALDQLLAHAAFPFQLYHYPVPG